MRVVDPMGRREARPEGILPAVALRLVRLEMDCEGSRLHERRDPTHLLLDHGVDLVVRVLRLVLEPADLHEELLPFPQAGEELHEVLGRDDPHGFVFLRDDDRRDVLLGHHLRRAVHLRVGADRERRIPHDALHLDDDFLLAACAVSGLISGGISRTVETFVAGGRLRRRISSRIVTTPTSFLRSMTGSSWMSFDFILPRTSPSVSSGLAATSSVDMKSDTRRSWTLFRFMKNPPRGESDSGLAYKKSAATGSRKRRKARSRDGQVWESRRLPRLRRLAGLDDEAALT